ncbi:MAG: hypothetical protein ACJ0QV_01980 [Gammaproteobacteria bacterium]|jgi:hypothetical protein
MGDPWKSITPKGVQAFVNATLATLLVWLSIENHLAMVINYMSNILSSHTAGLSAYYVIVAFVLYKLLYKRSSYDVNEKRATKYAILTMLLIWITWEGYLQFIIPIMGMIGIFPSLANSLIIGTVAFTVFITMYYGLHGKYFTTLMLEHMPWVIAPDKFLPFFWLWINAIVAGLLNAFDVNAFWYFVNLFFIFLLPSLFIGTKVQEKHGLRIQKKDDYFDE